GAHVPRGTGLLTRRRRRPDTIDTQPGSPTLPGMTQSTVAQKADGQSGTAPSETAPSEPAQSDTGTASLDEGTGRSPLRQGLSVLSIAIRSEPRIFALSVTGSAVYGVMTVGSAWAVGWATNHVVLPDLRRGSAPGAGLAAAGLLIMGVALLKVMGI